MSKLLILWFPIVAACVSNPTVHNQITKPATKAPEVLSYSVECNCDKGNVLQITTSYFKIPDNLGRYGFFATQQQLNLRKDRTIYPVENPATNSEYLVIDSDSISVLSTNITDVKCIKKDSDVVYSVYGSHSTYPEHEFFGILSKSGKWLWYYYGNNHEIFKQSGDLGPITRKFGDEIRSLKGMSDVLPVD